MGDVFSFPGAESALSCFSIYRAEYWSDLDDRCERPKAVSE